MPVSGRLTRSCSSVGAASLFSSSSIWMMTDGGSAVTAFANDRIRLLSDWSSILWSVLLIFAIGSDPVLVSGAEDGAALEALGVDVG